MIPQLMRGCLLVFSIKASDATEIEKEEVHN